MSKMLYSVTMSIDGFIAGPNGDMSWMTPYLGPNPTMDQLIDDIGALLVGHRTFGGDDPYKGVDGKEGKAFGGGWDGPQFVLSHHQPAAPPDDVTFVDNLSDAVQLSKAAAGDKYVNILGADTARQCLQAGLLDEVLTSVVPVFLGDGTRLFDVANGTAVGLEPLSVTRAGPATNLWFRVIRTG